MRRTTLPRTASQIHGPGRAESALDRPQVQASACGFDVRSNGGPPSSALCPGTPAPGDGTTTNRQLWALASPGDCPRGVSVAGLIVGFELKRRLTEEGVNIEVRIVPAHVRG